nr:transcription elongation factor, TFIIS/CRSP70 [Tanacetum cinerariifolium]
MRDKIAEMLFSRELNNYCGGGDMSFKKQSMNVSCEVQDEMTDKVLRIKAILDKSKINGETKTSRVELPLMVKQDKETNKSQRSVTVSIKLKHAKVKSAEDNASKGPLNPKQKVADKILKVAANNQKGPRVAPDQQFKSPMNSKEARNTKSGPTNTSFQEKLEAAKRKFQQHYMEEENLKKKRRIQVAELNEVIKKGRIPPKDQQVRHVNKQFRR